MKWKIKVGDSVEVISGDNRGKRSEVLRVLRDKMKLVILGVNVRKKFMKKCKEHPDGAILEREMPIHYSNVKKIEEVKKAE
jgi:large subunit ribosomal protein L24